MRRGRLRGRLDSLKQTRAKIEPRRDAELEAAIARLERAVAAPASLWPTDALHGRLPGSFEHEKRR